MGLARSTFYDEPEVQLVEEAWLVERIREVCAEWPAYGYRRVTAELRGEGRLVNHKKVMRLMKENGLTVRGHAGGSLQRPTATTTGRSSRTLPRISCRQTGTSSGSPTSVCRSKRRERWGLIPRDRLAGAGRKPP